MNIQGNRKEPDVNLERFDAFNLPVIHHKLPNIQTRLSLQIGLSIISV